jgi:hypothetical protein
MARMSSFEFSDLPSQFRQMLGKCRDLYVSAGEQVAREHPEVLPSSADHFIELMDDLHRGLVVKVFVSICEADRRWSKNEKFLAEVLFFHLWSQWVSGDELQAAITDMSERSLQLKLYSLIRPFDQIAPLRDRISELETAVIRLANIVARADGPLKDVTAARIQSLQDELHVHLRDIPIDEPSQHEEAERAGSQAIKKVYDLEGALPPVGREPRPGMKATEKAKDDQRIKIAEEAASPAKTEKTSEELLAEALAELDKLVGLAIVKEEVRTLSNFLKVQDKRKAAGLPTSALSLHMVYNGNPGTGKTTVARIVGKIFGAMGVLKKGHLVETDRSGLVAEYAGQTGPKTHKKIDEAIDGVLFIDEAYTLIASEGEDPFGREAVQTLLKRMEDDRDRLVVILAGYPFEMAILLRSNPGLSSRFSRQLDFADYSPLELCQIFGGMCDKNKYLLQAPVRGKTIRGVTWLHEGRDRHFGNGRTMRNLFEDAIRRQANRIASIAQLSIEQLSTLDTIDVVFKDCPPEELVSKDGQPEFRIECPKCEHDKDVPEKFLGQKVKCPKCTTEFAAEWGELAAKDPSPNSDPPPAESPPTNMPPAEPESP